MTGDVVLAAAVLAITFGVMAVAAAFGWYPLDVASYLTATVLAAVAWPLSRRFPRSSLILAALVVAWPAWFFSVPEIRVLPLVVAALRAASFGTSLVLVLPVTVLAGLAAVFQVQVVVLYYSTILSGVPALAAQFVENEARWLPVDLSRCLLTLIVLLVVVALGRGIAVQRRAADLLRARNEELVALREADRVRVAAEVRTAVARDIHDIVAHHVSAMVIRAQAADRTAADDASLLRQTLHAIADDGRDALTAMRRAVRMLRHDAADSAQPLDVDAEFASIIERVRASGREVEVSGSPGGDTEYAHLAVLRIVQEALTNVLLHSDAGAVRIHFTSDASSVTATVVDDGTATATTRPGGGNGIPGMIERAHALGGTLEAGPCETGWSVAVTLPRAGRVSEDVS